MSFIDGIKNVFGINARDEPDNDIALGVDENGETLYKTALISGIQEKLNKAKEERRPWELQWQLNTNFFCGNQFVDINIGSDKIEEYPRANGYEEREAYNQIEPLIETRIANLEKVSYLMRVKPRTDELADYSKARVSTALLQYEQINGGFDGKIHSAITLIELCGTAFFSAWWDSSKGETVGYGETTRIGKDGEETVTFPVCAGALDYGIITPYEVYPESCYKENICDQEYIIIEQVLSTSEIYNRYGIEVEGTDINTFSVCPRPNLGGFGYEATVTGTGTTISSDSAYLITYMEKPSRHYPSGRMVIYCEDNLIHYGALPGGEYPLIAMKSKNVSGRFFGKSVIETLIPLQRKYNGVKNLIMNHIHTSVVGGYFVEAGSVDVDEFVANATTPGSVIEYVRTPPIPKQNASLPQGVYQVYNDLRTELEYVAGVSQLMVSGTAPSGVTSGTAMQELQSIDNTRLSLTSNNIRDAVLELAKLWLSILRRNVTGYTACRTMGSNDMGDVLVWCRDDINSFDIEYTTENELVNSPEMQKAALLEAFQIGAFTDEDGRVPQRAKRKLAEALKTRDFLDVASNGELQEKYANRENAFAREGIVPEINNFDDHEIHIDEHMRFVLQGEFVQYRKNYPDKAQAFLDHIERHKAVLAEEQQKRIMQAQMMQAQMAQPQMTQSQMAQRGVNNNG